MGEGDDGLTSMLLRLNDCDFQIPHLTQSILVYHGQEWRAGVEIIQYHDLVCGAQQSISHIPLQGSLLEIYKLPLAVQLE